VENVILESLVGLRNNISKIISTFIKKVDWQPEFPKYDTIDQALEYMKAFCEKHYLWKSDPAYGLMDNVYSTRLCPFSYDFNGSLDTICKCTNEALLQH
jgi:hypothetical protein